MRIPDKLLYRRLNRIREELNLYINSHLPVSVNKVAAPMPESTPAELKRGGVQEKFLRYMKPDSSDMKRNDSEDIVFEEYLDEEDACPKKTPDKIGVEPLFSMADSKHAELDKVLEKKEASFSEMLLRMIDEKGLKDSDVYKRANIDRRLFSKIRGDAEYVPSKKTAISFCLALQLETEEAKKLLATAGYTLSASSRFDLIIMYLIETKEYNIHFANIVLDDYGEGTLSR